MCAAPSQCAATDQKNKGKATLPCSAGRGDVLWKLPWLPWGVLWGTFTEIGMHEATSLWYAGPARLDATSDQ